MYPRTCSSCSLRFLSVNLATVLKSITSTPSGRNTTRSGRTSLPSRPTSSRSLWTVPDPSNHADITGCSTAARTWLHTLFQSASLQRDQGHGRSNTRSTSPACMILATDRAPPCRRPWHRGCRGQDGRVRACGRPRSPWRCRGNGTRKRAHLRTLGPLPVAGQRIGKTR